jgi:hypothetical protein
MVGSTLLSKESQPMSTDTLTLSDAQVLTEAHAVVKEYLPLAADGYTCTTDTLVDALLGVAVQRGTLERVCTDWLHLAHAETVRGYLNDQLCVEDLPELERRLNAALAAQTPARLRGAPQEVACDFTDRPYYGKTPPQEGLWVRGRAQDGTTRFYRIATAYVIDHHLRVTLALHFVLPEDDALSVLQSILKGLLGRGIRITCLYLDKGFASIKVLRYLNACQQPAVIACPIRGKTHGTRALGRGNRSYRTTYTFERAEAGTCTVSLAVCRAFTTAKRTKRLKPRATWLIYILIQCDLSPQQVRRRYRRRFGIESSQVGGLQTIIGKRARCVAGPPRRIRPIALCGWRSVSFC